MALIFALGTLGLGWFVAGLKFGWSVRSTENDLPALHDKTPTSRD